VHYGYDTEPMTFAENTALGAPDQGDYLLVSEVAAYFRVEPATIYAAITAGEIQNVIRVGTRRGYRIPRASFKAYEESRRVHSAAPATAA
jgi:excisionase family DNA binding protein